jgi:hypothetical protein
VDRVRVGQVGPLDQAEVGQRDLDVVFLPEVEHRRGVLGVALVRRRQLADRQAGIDLDESEDVHRCGAVRHRDVPVGGDQ